MAMTVGKVDEKINDDKNKQANKDGAPSNALAKIKDPNQAHETLEMPKNVTVP